MYKRIDETKNVSDIVIELGNIIGKDNIKHSKHQTILQSNVTYVPDEECTNKLIYKHHLIVLAKEQIGKRLFFNR